MRFFKSPKFSTALYAILFFLAAILLLIDSDVVRSGVTKGLYSCAYVLIPSLFPFMVLSGVLNESKAAAGFQKILSPVVTHLFHLPAHTACAVFMGFIGGYPVGAKTIAELLDQNRIDEKTAGRMLCFCVNAGPSFLITAVGAGMLGNIKTGVLLLGCQWLSAILIGIFLGLLHRKEPFKNDSSQQDPLPFSGALVKGVQSGISGMLSVIAYVLIFSALIELLFSYLSANSQAGLYISGILEVTTGCIHVADGSRNLILIAFFISFSGLSIICQAMSFFKGKKIPYFPFYLSRLIHGELTALFMKVGIGLFPQTASAYASTAAHLAPQLSGSPTVAILLTILCGVFLFSFSTENNRRLD